MSEYSGVTVGPLTSQAEHLWRENRELRRALGAIVEAFEEPPAGKALEHYLRLEAAVVEAKTLL